MYIVYYMHNYIHRVVLYPQTGGPPGGVRQQRRASLAEAGRAGADAGGHAGDAAAQGPGAVVRLPARLCRRHDQGQ